jgi:glutamyl-tRNA reductase
MAPDLVLVGAGHSTAGIEMRERLALAPSRVEDLLAALVGRPGLQEALVLSTCGRTELYALADDPNETESHLLATLAGCAGSTPAGLAGVARVARGQAVVEHLHRVAAGLESMVLGEVEILGQLRRAGDLSLAAGARGRVLGRLVHHAMAAGRRVRNETDLASGRSSIASVAIGLAHTHLGARRGKQALVIGSGDVAAKAARALHATDIAVTVVAGRRPARARELAAEVGGHAVAPDEVRRLLTEVDLVVSGTGAPHNLLPAEAFATAAERRGGRALVVLDLALPRDIDPRTREVHGVHLYDLDDLRGEALATAGRRAAAVPAAEAVVADEVERFSRWLAALGVEPTIKDLRRHSRSAVLDALRRSELAAGAEEAIVEAATEAIVSRLLHAPTRRLRDATRDGNPDRLAHPLRHLFGLDGNVADVAA